MFNPTLVQVRQFFCETWYKHQSKQFITPQESIALRWMFEHPEYISTWESPDALHQEYSPDIGQTNPFLHLSLHLAIEEQISIDQPPGIRDLYRDFQSRTDSPHEAAHQIMDCLGEMLWQTQYYGTPFDNQAYLLCLHKKLNY